MDHTLRTRLAGAALMGALVLLIAGPCAGCGVFAKPNRVYVEADRLTFEAVDPIVRGMLDSDTGELDPAAVAASRAALEELELDNLRGLLDSWELRLEAAEERLGPKPGSPQ